MAIVKTCINMKAPIPKEVLEEIEAAAKLPVVPDEDCPELSDEQLAMLSKMAQKQRAERVKKVVSLRISPIALEKAQKLGKGYTGILSRILENALNNPELLKQCL